MKYDIPDIIFEIIPDFPRTSHLPQDPCAKRDDLVWSMTRAKEAMDGCDLVLVEEKVDGANCGLCFHDGEVWVRNRNHILRKGYTGRGTPAKDQFAPIWQKAHDFTKAIKRLAIELELEDCGIYGEWLWAQHTLGYDLLDKSFLYVFDVWDPETQRFLDPRRWRPIAEELGFALVPVITELDPRSIIDGRAAALRYGKSALRSPNAPGPSDMAGDREGVYVKCIRDGIVVDRVKAVRRSFADSMDDHWNDRELTRNRSTPSCESTT